MDHEKLSRDLKAMTEILMMKDDLDFKKAKREALLDAWRSYMPQGENSEDNELKRWIVKTWKVLLPGGGVPEEKELPEWLQKRLQAGREQAKADQERSNRKPADPAALAKDLKEMIFEAGTILRTTKTLLRNFHEMNAFVYKQYQALTNRESPCEGTGSGEVSRQPASIFENKHFDNSVYDKSSQSD